MSKIITTEILLERIKNFRSDKGNFYDYSQVEYKARNIKIKIICPKHGLFLQYPADHIRGFNGCKECSKTKTIETNLKRYGVENPFQSEKIKNKIREKNIEKYGVENPSQSTEIHQKKIETSLKNYGCEYPLQSEIIKQKSKQTNMEKYGVSYAMKLPEVAQKSIKTRIENNTFCKTNHSIECRDFIRDYIDKKGYNLNQCAFSDNENSLYEWGYYYKGKWILYDLVVFEDGFRGNKNKIIEMLEYHGPFHYTKEDVLERGCEKAFPWKSKKMTIKASYDIDVLKEEFARSLTINYNVIWSSKYHKNKKPI